MRKPHAKSKLKTPDNPERMESIYAYMTGHTLAETEAWLATQDVDTNPQSLSEFFHWYPVWLKMQRASNVAETVKEVLHELPQLNLQADQVAKTMQAVFEAEALADRDTELGVALMRLRQNDRMLDLKEESGRQKDRALSQKDEDLRIAKEKFRRDTAEMFVAWFADEKAKEIMHSGASKAEKIEALGKTMFGEDW